MKLLMITCIDEYKKDVKNILKHAGVKAFSYQAVKGYKNNGNDNISNWFVVEDLPTESLLFTAFIEDACVDEIISRAEQFNSALDSISKLHLVSLNIEKTI